MDYDGISKCTVSQSKWIQVNFICFGFDHFLKEFSENIIRIIGLEVLHRVCKGKMQSIRSKQLHIYSLISFLFECGFHLKSWRKTVWINYASAWIFHNMNFFILSLWCVWHLLYSSKCHHAIQQTFPSHYSITKGFYLQCYDNARTFHNLYP